MICPRCTSSEVRGERLTQGRKSVELVKFSTCMSSLSVVEKIIPSTISASFVGRTSVLLACGSPCAHASCAPTNLQRAKPNRNASSCTPTYLASPLSTKKNSSPVRKILFPWAGFAPRRPRARAGFVRISVKIIDVREAYFRVATDADLARSVTGRGGGGDFADWSTCLPAKSFKHDQLLYVVRTYM